MVMERLFFLGVCISCVKIFGSVCFKLAEIYCIVFSVIFIIAIHFQKVWSNATIVHCVAWFTGNTFWYI